MGNNTSQVPEEPSTVTQDEGVKKLKPCCACPETKRARDECIILQGQENCLSLINAHKKCMRDHGFEI